MKRIALVSAALLAASCINFGDVVTECTKPGGRCAPAVPDAGPGGGGGGGSGGGSGGTGGGGGSGGPVDAGDAGPADAGDAGPVDAGCTAFLCREGQQILPAFVSAIDEGEGDFWAVGRKPAGGPVVFHRSDAGVWEGVAVTTVTDTLRALDVTKANHVWAAGDNSTVVQMLNDGNWTRLANPTPSTHLYAIWVGADGLAYVAGAAGRVFRQTTPSGGWLKEKDFGSYDLRAIWGSADGVVWAGGNFGLLARRLPDAGWQDLDAGIPDTVSIVSIWGSAANDVWLATDENSKPGNIIHFDGSAFMTTVMPTKLAEVHGTAANDVWLAGDVDNVLYHFDGGGSFQQVAAFDGGLLADGGRDFGFGPLLLRAAGNSLILMSAPSSTTSAIHHFRINR